MIEAKFTPEFLGHSNTDKSLTKDRLAGGIGDLRISKNCSRYTNLSVIHMYFTSFYMR